ncbi:MAG: ABC transporter ATP-binding protein [Acidimicrobiaceae bacterium]|nr:ABC transporter ATP-binding protein [Acidimicrobiaceae bacterium]MBT5581920.1 ABC transporter ATP-binding protein [Acidimicrobiaceae bacterium]MBT5852020.1 ABC transporter ATP-binding protein [Acidimicrobiaceae bacterium]
MTLPPPPPDPTTRVDVGPMVGDPMADNIVVEAFGVTKAFGDVVAVSDVSFRLGPGLTALLGPNGAGKSTLFRMLCGLTQPSKGNVRVFGKNARRDRDVRGRIGLAPQQDAMFDRLSALEFVTLAAATHGIAGPETAARRSLDLVEISADDPKRVGAFSKGMRQRVKLAAALVNDPDLLVLDEPLTGLDPVQRNRMIALFNELAAAGKCILVSSHVLDEVARLGSNIIVIAQGRLAASGNYHALRGLMDDRPHRIRVGTDQPRRLGAAILERGVAEGVSVVEDRLMLDTRDVDLFGRQVAPLAVELGVELNELVPLDDDLESVFRYLVERR